MVSGMIDYTLPLDQLPDPLPIEPLRKPFDVTITPPGSKSITCRAYVLAALAEGESKIIRPLRAEDTDLLLEALCTLGAEARWAPGGEDVFIKGVRGRFPRGGSVYLGDGGTPTRFMIACACLAAEPVIVDASPRMRQRPIAEGVEMLRQLGAKIEYVEEEGRLPVRVLPSAKFSGGGVTIGTTASSQFISACMLIAPVLHNGVQLRFRGEATSRSYINLTLGCLMDWDIDFYNIERFPDVVSVHHSPLIARVVRIEPDASSATYWIVAAAISGSAAGIPALQFDSQQPDVAIMKILQPQVFEWTSGEQWASKVRWPVSSTAVEPLNQDASLYPDGALALAIACAFAEGSSRITGLRTLRVKETDRIAALASELRKIGCTVQTGEDWIEITPPTKNPPAEPGAEGDVVIETYNDHRMAMAFAVLGLARPGISIRNPACVKKSYPTFWKDFAKLYQ